MSYCDDGIFIFDFYDNFKMINLNIPDLSNDYESAKDLILTKLIDAINILRKSNIVGDKNSSNDIEIDKTIIYSPVNNDIDCFFYVSGELDNSHFEIYFMPKFNNVYYKYTCYNECGNMFQEKILDIFLICQNLLKNNNFSIKSFDSNDYFKYRKVNFNDFGCFYLFFNYIADFINVIGGKELSHLLIFEKICRYLEYGKSQFDRYDTLWSEYFLTKELSKLGYDFRNIVIGTLSNFDKSNKMLNYKSYSPNLDAGYILDAMYKEYQKDMPLPNIESLNQRVENIRFAPFMNVRPILSFKDVYHIFYTYAKETYIECGQNQIASKIIDIPGYEKFLLVKCSDVTFELKNKLIFNGRTLKDALIFSTQNERYLLIVSNKRRD